MHGRGRGLLVLYFILVTRCGTVKLGCLGRGCTTQKPNDISCGIGVTLANRPTHPTHSLSTHMDYPDYPPQQQQQQQQQQSSSQRGWPSQPFPTPTSPGPFYFQQTSPTNGTPPTNLNMRPATHQQGPFQDQQLHAQHPLAHPIPHHSHSHSSGSATLSVSPISPVSPGDFSPVHLSTQSNFSFNFPDPSANSGLSPAQDPVLSQRRPSTGSHSTSSAELSVEKSVPRKRSLTSAAPASHAPALATHSMHAHSQSHSGYTTAHGHSHPIITTTASSPPPPSPTSPSSSHASHSISLSHSHSHTSLSQSPSHPGFQSQHSTQVQLDINANPNPYDDLDGAAPFGIISDDVSDDEYGLACASGSGGAVTGKAGAGQGTAQGVSGKAMGTNNFVTKLYHMINDPKSQHYIMWTEHGTSFVVSNVGEFSRSILGSHFKHNNFSSFVRQLNMYGFHKINRTPRAQRTSTSSQTWEFSHPKFLRERPDLLDAIKRKALEPDPRERGRVELPGEVARFLGSIREENRALWQEIRQLGGQIPPQFTNSLGSPSHSKSLSVLTQNHTLSHSRSSSNLGDEGERDGVWDDEEPTSGGPGGATGNTEPFGGLHIQTAVGGTVPLSLAGLSPSLHTHSPSPQPPSPSEEWCRWAEAEIAKGKRRVDKLVHVVRVLVNVMNSGANNPAAKGTGPALGPSTGTGKTGEGEDVLATILRDLHALSLDRSSHPPSPSGSPNLMHLQGQSPNIYITSPTSPSPFVPLHGPTPQSHPASRMGLPTLSIPAGSGFALHTPSSSPTGSDYPGTCFMQRSFGPRNHGHSPQPSITLTPDDDGERGECKRPRVDGGAPVEGNVGVGIGMGVETGEMEVVADTEEDSKLPTPLSLTGTPCLGSDSASMWRAGGDGNTGASNNTSAGGTGTNGPNVSGWGRRRSGSGYGR